MPRLRGIMMIYKGSSTIQGYDSTNPHPNPRLREVVKTDPSLAARYSFGAE